MRRLARVQVLILESPSYRQRDAHNRRATLNPRARSAMLTNTSRWSHARGNEIVQPWTSMSSSRVSMSGGAPLSWCVVRDHQPQGSPAYLSGATRVGNFSEQVWGLSHERHHHFLQRAGRAEPAAEEPLRDRASTSTVAASTRLEVCTWATARPVVSTVQTPSIPPNGHHASADSPPDVTWPTACQPTTATTTAWMACRAQRTFDPQLFGRRGTRTRTSAAASGLLPVRSSCMVIDVSSW